MTMATQNLPGLELQIGATVVTEPGNTPSTVVIAGTPWGIDVEWTVSGRNASLIGGVWLVRAFIDGIPVPLSGLVDAGLVEVYAPLR
jgi:hypothetical protein